MDYYDPGRLRSYRNAMIKGEANSLHAYAHLLSVDHLRDSHVQFLFTLDVDKFIRAHLTQFNLKKDEPAFKACIASLREERSHLEKQHALLNAREAKVVASAELTHQLDTWGYIINGVSVVISGFVVVAGLGVVLASGATGNIFGMEAGTAMVLHGSSWFFMVLIIS